MEAKFYEKKGTEIARTISHFYLCFNFQMSLGIFSSRRIIFIKKNPIQSSKGNKNEIKSFWTVFFVYFFIAPKNTRTREGKKKKIVKDVPP